MSKIRSRLIATAATAAVALSLSLPASALEIRLGRSEVLKDGKDIAIFALGSMVGRALEAADRLKEYNVDVEVITTITHKKATVPQNILIYDIQRTYTNSNDYVGTNGFKYINGPDYIDLFEDVE